MQDITVIPDAVSDATVDSRQATGHSNNRAGMAADGP